jgi:hypothetical protein
MIHKFLLLCLILTGVSVAASAQGKRKPAPAAKPLAARIVVEGYYEENFQGTTDDGRVDAKLVIEFQANRWVKMSTNEAGSAEFSELPNAPAPSVSGSVSYNGLVKGAGSDGDSHEATSSFAGRLEAQDVHLGVPQYSNTAEGLKMTVRIVPKLKGKCFTDSVRGGQRSTSVDCYNGTFFFTPATPLNVSVNNDPARTDDKANKATFGMELTVEPEVGGGGVDAETGPVEEAAKMRKELAKMTEQSPAGDAGVDAWRGAVTNGSKEAGFKIMLEKNKELPSNDGRGRTTRRLIFSATIVPGAPGSQAAPEAPKKVDNPPLP